MYKEYTYCGRVYDEHDNDLGEWSGTTMAESPGHAKSNLLYRARIFFKIPDGHRVFFASPIKRN